MARDFIDQIFNLGIIERAQRLYRQVGIRDDRLTLIMDLDNANTFVELNPVILSEMDDSNFAHDIVGIRNHMNRETGQLEDFFVPRCAAFQHQSAS